MIFFTVAAFTLIFLTGCRTFFPQPTATPTSTNTPEPPTATPIPTDTPVPTPTVEPTLPPTNTPFPTLPPPPTLTNTPSGQKAIYIYYIQKKTGGNVACGDTLVPLTVNLYRTASVEEDIERALNTLFSFHSAEFGELYNPLYLSKLSVVSVEFDAGGKTVVNLQGDIKLSDDKCDSSRIFAQLVATIRQFPLVVGNPSIHLNGAGIKNFLP
jgi:hypothetical protein